MNNIRLILSDIDGTLAAHMQNEITNAVRQAIIDVENKGIEIATITGRQYPAAKNLLIVLGIEGPCIFDGGATIADVVSGEIVWKQWLDVQTTRAVVDIVRKYCTEAYFNPRYEMTTLEGLDTELINEEAPCIFAVADTMEAIEALVEALEDIPDIYTYAGMGTHPDTNKSMPSIQIAHVNANKFHGVEALRNITGIPKEYTLAIGDGNNDIPLFENARIKIAMGNATDLLKSKADYVVGSLEQDGFAEAMNKYTLK